MLHGARCAPWFLVLAPGSDRIQSSMSCALFSQEDIDTALCAWNGNIESKHAVRYMDARKDSRMAGSGIRCSNSNSLPSVPAARRKRSCLAEGTAQACPAYSLIQEDRFYTEEEQDRFDNIDPIAIREALEERGIVNGQVADPEKLDNDPFIQQVMSDAEQIAAAETEQTSEVSISDEEYEPNSAKNLL